MKIFVTSDHGGFEFKNAIYEHLFHHGYDVEDVGPQTLDPHDDYPEYVFKMTTKILGSVDKDPRGIVAAGSGQGEAIAANRASGIRAAVFYGPVQAKRAVDVTGRKSTDPYEILRLSREHNNTNVLSLGGRFLTDEEAIKAVDMWLKEPFPGHERHKRRLEKIEKLYG